MGDAIPLDLYRRDQRRRGLSAVHVAKTRSRLMQLRAGMGKPLAQAHEEDIQRFLDSRTLSSGSRAGYISTYHTFYIWAVKNRLVRKDPTAEIVPPRIPRRKPRPMTPADLEWALAGADTRMRLWLLLANYEGLRCVEMANLRREDIMDDRDPPLLFITGKGSHERLLPLNPAVEAALHDFGLPRTGPLFIGRRTKKPLTAANISLYICKHLKAREVRSTAHKGRHAFATNIYGLTKDLRLTQELMGHSSPQTTIVYTDYDKEEAVRAVRQLGVNAEGAKVGS